MLQLTTKKSIQLILGFGISVGLIYWVYGQSDWQIVGNELSNMRFWVFLPGLVVIVFHFYLRALRWCYLLPERPEKTSLTVLFDSIMVGNFATYILPLRAGEFIRPFMLSRTSKYSFSSSFASVVIERFFDLATVLATFSIVLALVDGLPEWVFAGAKALGVLALAIVVFIGACAVWPGRLTGFCRYFLAYLPSKIRGGCDQFLQDFIHSAAVLNSPRRLAITVALSLAVWLTCYLYFYVSLFLFTDSGTMTLAVTAAVIVALAVAAPSAPGFVGVYQVGCIAAFKLFDFSVEVATAYAIITHLLQYILYIIYGFYALSKYGLSLSSLRKKGAA